MEVVKTHVERWVTKCRENSREGGVAHRQHDDRRNSLTRRDSHILCAPSGRRRGIDDEPARVDNYTVPLSRRCAWQNKLHLGHAVKRVPHALRHACWYNRYYWASCRSDGELHEARHAERFLSDMQPSSGVFRRPIRTVTACYYALFRGVVLDNTLLTP